jgi:putative hydrolase of HD superfamily
VTAAKSEVHDVPGGGGPDGGPTPGETRAGPAAGSPDGLEALVDFLRRAERLKDTVRSGYTSGGRRESVADHTWRLCLMAIVLQHRFPDVDAARLIKICVVHDLGEALHGDIPAPEQAAGGKAADERRDLVELLAPLPDFLGDEIVGLWDEYEAASSPEARLAKALDKLETLLQHTQGANPPEFDYRFNLDYGRAYTAHDPTIAAIRELLDRETERRAGEAERPHRASG